MHCLPLRAQSSPPHSVLTALYDSLSSIRDTSALKSALGRGPASDLVRQGFLALRLAELGVDPDFDRAIAFFRKATDRSPHEPAGWYGLGLADAGRSQWEMRDRLRLGSRVGLGRLERAAADHASALSVDPKYVPAALALARIELTLLEQKRLQRARDLLRRTIAAVSPAPPDLLLAWGRVERAT